MHRLGLLVLLLGSAWSSLAAAKRLIVFGDSISDNGNGTNAMVQAYFSQLLGQNVTAVSKHTLHHPMLELPENPPYSSRLLISADAAKPSPPLPGLCSVRCHGQWLM